jgi:hypothetical protein
MKPLGAARLETTLDHADSAFKPNLAASGASSPVWGRLFASKFMRFYTKHHCLIQDKASTRHRCGRLRRPPGAVQSLHGRWSVRHRPYRRKGTGRIDMAVGKPCYGDTDGISHLTASVNRHAIGPPAIPVELVICLESMRDSQMRQEKTNVPKSDPALAHKPRASPIRRRVLLATCAWSLLFYPPWVAARSVSPVTVTAR